MSTTTIAIPCYNAGGFLRDCVESCLRQTIPAKEIIVVNDASTDPETLHVLQDLGSQPCVHIINNVTNLGKAHSLNRLFDSCTTDYLILQDADDLAMPHRVERQVDFMESHPSIACSSSFVRYINKHGHPLGHGKLDLLSPEKLREYLENNEPFGLFCPAVILRTEIFKNSKLRFRGEFWPADDIDLWNRIAEAGYKVVAQPEFLVEYRVHGDSAVTSNFVKTRLQYEFVRIGLRARRSGKAEPTRDEFLGQFNSRPFWQRLNWKRKTLAKNYYRSAGFSYGEKKIGRAVIQMMTACALQPGYVIPRLIQQIF